MSVHFSADSIVDPSCINIANTNHTALMNGQINFNSISSKMEETDRALMDTQQHNQGRTPDANNTASHMSSDFNKNQREQHQRHLNSTSQMAANTTNAQDLFAQLHEAIALEPKYQPNLFLPLQSNVSFCYRYLSLENSIYIRDPRIYFYDDVMSSPVFV